MSMNFEDFMLKHGEPIKWPEQRGMWLFPTGARFIEGDIERCFEPPQSQYERCELQRTYYELLADQIHEQMEKEFQMNAGPERLATVGHKLDDARDKQEQYRMERDSSPEGQEEVAKKQLEREEAAERQSRVAYYDGKLKKEFDDNREQLASKYGLGGVMPTGFNIETPYQKLARQAQREVARITTPNITLLHPGDIAHLPRSRNGRR